MTTKGLIFLLICGLATSLCAQDYVVTNKGDTVRGKVKILTYDNMDRVQITTDKKNQFTALQVKRVFYDGELYKPVQLSNSIQFMKIMKDGYLSILAFRLPNQMIYDGRYLLKKDGRGIELPNIGFKKIMSQYVSECPDVVAKIKAEDLKRSDIDNVVEEFNACIDTKTQNARNENIVKQQSQSKGEVIQALVVKVSAMDAFPEKQDALDLLNDVAQKVSNQQVVSNYQVETLRKFLGGKESVKTELENVLAALKGN